MTTLTTRPWPRGTVEYLEAEIIANVEIADDEPVEFTFDRQTFHTGAWIGDAATTRVCRVLVDDTMLPDGAQTVDVFVRVTDDPEVPLIPQGSLQII